VFCLFYLPVVDFLPYKIGNNIQALTLIPADAEKDVFEMVFVYEKAGQT